MAFIPRQAAKNTDESQKGGIEVDVSVGVRKESSTESKPYYSDSELRSYEEQAKMVLDLLDKRGINIYDEDRTPGMYLRTKNGTSKNIIETLSGGKPIQKNQHSQHQDSQTEQELSKPAEGLLNFFNKSK